MTLIKYSHYMASKTPVNKKKRSKIIVTQEHVKNEKKIQDELESIAKLGKITRNSNNNKSNFNRVTVPNVQKKEIRVPNVMLNNKNARVVQPINIINSTVNHKFAKKPATQSKPFISNINKNIKTKQPLKVAQVKNFDHLFVKDKINVVYATCFIPTWVVMYTFYLLEIKTFQYTDEFSAKNINLINITSFYSGKIRYQDIKRTDFQRITDECMTRFIETATKPCNREIKKVLYMINDVVYNIFFNKYQDLNSIKASGTKIVLWRDDLFSFSPTRLVSKVELKTNFKSRQLECADLILSSSTRYFENTKSMYLNKTLFYPYSLDENLFDSFDIPYTQKINKILISGTWHHFIYEKRKQLAENYNKSLFDIIARPPNKYDQNKHNYKISENGMTGYYKKIGKYKGAVMTLASYPLDFILGKFFEVYNANTLPFLDYSDELDCRLMLNPFDDYIPLLSNKNNYVIQEVEYYNKFLLNDILHTKIVNHGRNIMRKNFNVRRTAKLLSINIQSLFNTHKQPDINNISNKIYYVNNFEILNVLVLGQLSSLISKFKIKVKITSQDKSILDILRNKYYKSGSLNIYDVTDNNTVIYDILDLFEDCNSRYITNLDDDYLFNNCVNQLLYPEVILGTPQICSKTTIVVTNNQQYLFLRNIVNSMIKPYNNHNTHIINITGDNDIIVKDNDVVITNILSAVDILNQTNLCLCFDEEYSAFVKNCGVKNILLFNDKPKKIANKLYNPFFTNEITVYVNNYTTPSIDKYEINKIAFMIHNLYKVTVPFNNIVNSINHNTITLPSTEIIKPVLTLDSTSYYYYGEFGFFNVVVLGNLEKIFSSSGSKTIMKIRTYEDFATILQIKFPNNIVTESITLEKDREYNTSKLVTPPSGYKDLAYAFKFTRDLNRGMLPMKIPITYSDDVFKNKHKDKKYIAIFPRNRFGRFAYRNLTTQLFNLIEPVVKSFNKHEIIFMGSSTEVNTEIIKKYPHYSNIREAIYILNNHVSVLIAPDSGFIDFAKNTAVKSIVLLYKSRYIGYHNKFNPFKTIFRSCDYKNIDTAPGSVTEDFKKILTELVV